MVRMRTKCLNKVHRNSSKIILNSFSPDIRKWIENGFFFPCLDLLPRTWYTIKQIQAKHKKRCEVKLPKDKENGSLTSLANFCQAVYDNSNPSFIFARTSEMFP